MTSLLPIAEPTPGTEIGRYRVCGVLGRGGMAAVLDVEDAQTGERRALKLLLPGALSDEVITRFDAEHRTLVSLNHPNILRVYERGEWQGRPWFAMERLRGRDLRDVVEDWREHPPPDRFARVEALLVQVAEALAYIHDRGLVHRDITPGNIMLGPDNTARLMDFGVVKEPGVEMTVVGEMVGTVAYIAPEQITSDDIDARADLYSLGTVLYLLLTGRRPFNASTVPGYLDKHLNLRPRAPRELMPQVPDRLDAICMRLLEKRPADRFGSAHHLLAVLGRPGERAGSLDPRSWPPRLVGRPRSLARLRELAAGVAMGRGGVLVLEAPSGYGKTSLIQALTGWAADLGLPVDRGRCDGSTWGPFRQLLKPLVPRAEDLPGPLKTGLLQSGEVEGAAVYAAFRDLLRQRLPRVLVLDDVHRADRGTLDFLESVLRSFFIQARQPLLLILARRPPRGPDRLQPVLDLLPADRAPTRLSLEPISTSAVEELLLQLVADGPRTRKLAERLHREGEGNPQFISEMIRGLVEEGVILERGARFSLELTDVSRVRLPIPSNIREALRERLRDLSPPARAVASFIAICRREVTLDLLLEALEDELAERDERVMDLLDDLLDAGVVRQREVGVEELFELAQNRLSDVLIEGLDAGELRHLHARAGVAMERLYRHRLASVVEVIALHFERGHMAGKAYPYLIRAGQRLMDRSFMPEALDCFERALLIEPRARDLLPLDEADRKLADLYRLRGIALEHMGRWSDAWTELRTSDRLAREAQDDRLRSQVLAQLGRLAVRQTRWEEGETQLTEALTLADRLGDTRLRLGPLYTLGSTRWAQGDLDGARRYWLDTLAAAGTVQDDVALARGYRGLGVAALCRGNTAEARKFLEQSCQKFESLGMLGPLAISRVNLVEVCHCTGNLRKGLQIAERTIAQAREVEHRQGIALGLLYRSLILVDLVRTGEAVASATEARDIFEELEAADDQLAAYTYLVRAALSDGDLDRAEENVSRAEVLMESCDPEGYRPLFTCWRALLMARRGDGPGARVTLAFARDAERSPFAYQRVRLSLISARTLAALDDPREAAEHAGEALREADQCGFRFYSLKAHRLLAEVCEDPDELARHRRIGRSLSRSLAAGLARADAARFLKRWGEGPP